MTFGDSVFGWSLHVSTVTVQYQDGTKWVCTTRDVPGTKTSGRMEKREHHQLKLKSV